MALGVGWQPPEGGISEALQQRFFEHLDPQSAADGGCWFWKGPTNAYRPALMVDGGYVTALRIAYAIEHNAARIPGKFHKCTLQPEKCINPQHCLAYAAVAPKEKPPAVVLICSDCKEPIKGADWSNEADRNTCETCEKIRMGVIAKPSMMSDVAAAEVHRQTHAPPKGPASMDDMLSGFRALDALASIQYGKTPETRHTIVRQAEERVIHPAEGPTRVTIPVGTIIEEPKPAKRAKYQPVSAQELLEVIFAPNTICVTFPSGSVMISGPGGRVIAPDPAAAVQQMLYSSGARKIVG